MGDKLSVCLCRAGFVSVYGTVEKVGDKMQEVCLGDPYTWDTNNGITVVYDEFGSPWIRRPTISLDKFANGKFENDLLRGAYVPHSNDGGKFWEKYSIRKTAIDETVRGAHLMLVIEMMVRRVMESGGFGIGGLKNDIARLHEVAKLIHWATTSDQLSSAHRELLELEEEARQS